MKKIKIEREPVGRLDVKVSTLFYRQRTASESQEGPLEPWRSRLMQPPVRITLCT